MQGETVWNPANDSPINSFRVKTALSFTTKRKSIRNSSQQNWFVKIVLKRLNMRQQSSNERYKSWQIGRKTRNLFPIEDQIVFPLCCLVGNLYLRESQ